MAKPTRSTGKVEGASRKKQTRSNKGKARAVATTKATSLEESDKHRTLPPAWQIGWRSLQTVWQYRLVWLIIGGLYLLLDLILIRSVSIFDVANLKQALDPELQQGPAVILGGVNVLSSLMAAGAAGASSEVTGAYRFFLVIVMSLVVIWLLRQANSRDGITSFTDIRTAFYEGSTPLIPFLLILALMVVQSLPLLIVMTIYSFALSGGITTTVLQQFGATLVLFGVAFLTVIWLVRTITALYIVTLPGMLPLQAFSNAKELVRGRRLSVMRKLLFVPLALFIAAALVMVPAILIWAPLAQWLFFVLTAVGFIATHAYLYALYRELLK